LSDRIGKMLVTPDEKELLNKLCGQIAVEKDHHKFTHLVDELDRLLERKERRLEQGEESPSTPKSQPDPVEL
jgi:hypothetical protein